MHINDTRCIYYSFSECVVFARMWLPCCFAASGSVLLSRNEGHVWHALNMIYMTLACMLSMHALSQSAFSPELPSLPAWRLAYCDGCSGQPTSGPATRSPPSLAPARRTRSQTPALGPRETKRDCRNMHINATRCIYMYVCMYVCICMYVCMYVCMYECMYVCMFVCLYVCM